MTKPQEGFRIRVPRVRQGRLREVDKSPNYCDRTGLVGSNPEVADNLWQIIKCLERGDLLPEKLYRNLVDQNEDLMLKSLGINHVHLHEDREIDALLFFVEYPNFALLLEVDGHRNHFKAPVGAVLASTHNSALTRADQLAQKRSEDLKERVKRGLLPRKARDAKES